MFMASAGAMILVAVLFCVAYPRTEYAAAFSQAKYRRIRAGMTGDEVRGILGEPLSAEPLPTYGRAPFMEWQYSRDRKGGPLDVGWYDRSLVLSNGIVVEKPAQFVFEPGWVGKGQSKQPPHVGCYDC